MKIDNADSVPWRRSISEETLARWPDDILIMDISRLGLVDWPIEKCILTSERTEPPVVVETIIACGAHHFIQSANPKFNHAVNLAAQMIHDPSSFINSPIESYFTSRGPDFASKSFQFRSSREKFKLLQEMSNSLEEVTGQNNVTDAVAIIAEELFTNALFNAPQDQANAPKHLKLRRNSAHELEPGHHAELFLASDKQILLIGCSDPYGTLKPNKVLNLLRDCYSSGVNHAINLGQGGAGIGCYLMMEQSSSFFLLTNPGEKSVVMASVPLGVAAKVSSAIPKNLHLIPGHVAQPEVEIKNLLKMKIPGFE